MRPSHVRYWLPAILLLGGAVRAVDLWHPVDGHIREAWRECDMAGIARNYYREGMNIFYPRTDWRGDGPGFTEVEFPFLSWGMAAAYQAVGVEEVVGRLISYAAALLSLVLLYLIARRVLDVPGALAATAFLALNPLHVRLSNSLQPESLMLLAYLAAVYAFLRWLDEPHWRWWVAVALTTAAALLAKATTAHLGVLFAVLAYRKWGLSAIRRPALWALAAAAVAPAVAWYAHAHGFWEQYGNSLGMSNETHWLALDLRGLRAAVLGNVTAEAFEVWTPLGPVVAAYGAAGRLSSDPVKLALPWLLAAALFYVVAGGTSGDSWAVYYHVFSVPATALLVGAGVGRILEAGTARPHSAVVMAGVALGVALAVSLGSDELALNFGSSRLVRAIALGLPGLATLALLWAGSRSTLLPSLAGRAAAFALPAVFLVQGGMIARDFNPDRMEPQFRCAQQLRPHIPEGELIVASGGICRDAQGRPVAYNASFMFYWLDRKGFNVCVEEQSVSALERLAERGARYFVADKTTVAVTPGFAADLARTYRLVAECPVAWLYELRPGRAPSENAAVTPAEPRP